MKRSAFIVLLIVFFSAGQAAAKRVYVRAGAIGANTGTAWSDAYPDLQAAILASAALDTLWVAKGTYKPTNDTNRNLSFSFSKRLFLFGGFGGSETQLNQRNVQANPTVLSGDLGLPGDTSDNSRQLVSIGIGATRMLLDGFQVENGPTIYVNNASVTINNCLFSGNLAAYYGGLITLSSNISTPETCAVNNCEFTGNLGGLDISPSTGGNITAFINDCRFLNNRGTLLTAGSWGRAVVQLERCTFTGNSDSGNGLIDAGSWGTTRVSFYYCTFRDNLAQGYNGLVNVGSWGTTALLFENCVLANRVTYPYADAFNLSSARDTLTFVNCTLADSVGPQNVIVSLGSGIGKIYNSIVWNVSGNALSYSGTAPTVSRSCLSGNPFPGNGNIGSHPLFVSPADFHLHPISPCIDAADAATAPLFDIELNARSDNPLVANTGIGTPPYVDMGAYEFFINPAGNAPYIMSPAEASAMQGSLFSYAVQAVDVDGDSVTFTFPGLPGWMWVLNDTIKGNVTQFTYDTIFTIVASDGRLSDTLKVTVHNLSVVVPKNGTWTYFDTSNGLKNNAVTSIEIGAQGTKWIGTLGGLHKLSGGSWTVYTDSNSSLPSRAISSVYEDRNRKLWVGTVSSGLASLSGTTWQTHTISSSGGYTLGNRIHAVIEDSSGRIWVGGEGEYRTSPYAGYYGNGLASLSSGAWTVYNQSPAGRSLYHVQDLSRAANNDLWFAVRGVYIGYTINVDGMLVRYRNGAWTEYMRSTVPEIPQNNFNAVANDKTGALWAGTQDKGVVKFDGAAWTLFNKYSGIIDTNINAIAVDSADNKWIGTSRGLSMYDGVSWTNYGARDGLPGLQVNAIAVEKDTVWIGTNNGLARFVYRPGISVELLPKSLPGKVAMSVGPNPFHAVTIIHYNAGRTSSGKVSIFDVAGREIFSAKVTGRGGLSWSAGPRASGIYVCRLVVKGTILNKTIVLVK